MVQWIREFRGDPGDKEFIILILVSYKGWKHKTRSGDLNDMELKALRNDPHLLLDFLNYRHDDKSRTWLFFMDFDLEYTDWTGVTRVLPRAGMPKKATLLKAVRKATRKGSSGFIHVGAHCNYDYLGTSHLEVMGGTTKYTEIPKASAKAAYFISSDGQRVYGTEFHSSLSDNLDASRDATLTLSFDMCNADAFLKDVIDLPCVYNAPPDSPSQTAVVEKGKARKQLIVISSSRTGQQSGSLQDPAGYQGLFGAATFLMIECLSENPSFSPEAVVKYINDVCVKRPEEHLRQSLCIASRYPLTGPLRLLPGPIAGL